MSDADARLAVSALDAPVLPPNILLILDELTSNLIKYSLYEYVEMKDPATGRVEKRPSRCLYPDIEQMVAVALRHHNLVLNFSWEERTSMLNDFRVNWYLRLKRRHRSDSTALAIIKSCWDLYRGNIMGASTEGTFQGFYAKSVGAIKELIMGGKKE